VARASKYFIPFRTVNSLTTALLTPFQSSYYTWSPNKVGKAASAGFQFAAQLWGDKQTGDFQSLVLSNVQSFLNKGTNDLYANIALGMNE
jgi:hypothetical protein